MVAVEQSPASVVLTDLDANITYTNRRFTEITGYTKEEAKEKIRGSYSQVNILKSSIRAYGKLFLSGKVWSGAFRNKRKMASCFGKKRR